ncbi:MAG: DNA topoisomerase 1 [Thelocarpon superellum]|nr:MAG: DNA topoisomerase 1 [Thelocarpon superellum]
MSSSEDDEMPLIRGRKSNGTNGNVKSPVSKEIISKNTDDAMDKVTPSGNGVGPGLSIRNGPVDEMDIDEPEVNGATTNGNAAGKRKARQSAGTTKTIKESSSDEEDDKPLSKRRRTSNKATTVDDSTSDSDDVPLASQKATTKVSKGEAKKPSKADANGQGSKVRLLEQKARIEKRAEQQADAIEKKDKVAAKKKAKVEDNDSDVPLSQTKRKSTGTNAAAKVKKQSNGVKKHDSDDDDTPLKRKVPAKKGAPKIESTTSTPVKKSGKGKGPKKEETPDEDEAEDEDEEYRWWEDPTKGDGSKKWNTLEHAGVVFPPPYEPLPANVKLRYDGVPVTLDPEAEEVAGFFGSMLNSTVNMENPTFIKNFFEDFREILSKTGGAKDAKGNKIKIKEFAKCDFNPIFDYYEAKRLEKKAMPPAEKKRLKAEKDAAELPYLYCLWDGRKERVGNFRVEPPSLFRGRGEHPKTGRVKKRVAPEQITINIGKEATVPAPPEGHRWKEVKHDQTGTWLAMWQENINGAYKYVMLAATSAIKGQSDFKKFEKARELKKHIKRIRKDYEKDLKAELTADRQKATAMYLIDRLALRAGNEKGEDEAETVGCCSLKFEHVTLKPPNTVILDFLGKDSIRYYDEVEVDTQVFKNLKIFKKPPKTDGDQIFDRLSTTQLNAHLRGYMEGLTAKVFRTYNASFTMSNLLQEMKSVGSVMERVKDYNDANRRVAILCNHKRTVGAAHATQMEKMTEKINGLKYQQWRIKQMMIDIEPKVKKQKGAGYFALPDDLTEEWVLRHQAFLVDEMRQKIEKKFQKDNEKLAAEGEREMKPKELEDRMAPVHELEKKFKKENKTKKVEAEGKGATIEKMEANLVKLDERIAVMGLQAQDKESNKEVALGTSKINYIDPRLTVVFTKKFNVPIEKFFSKSLREKFDWAIKSVDENWTF